MIAFSVMKLKNAICRNRLNCFGFRVHISCPDAASFSDILQVVTSQATAPDAGRLFAVVHLQGAQRKVTVEDIVVLRSHLEANVGETINLNKVSYQICIAIS